VSCSIVLGMLKYAPPTIGKKAVSLFLSVFIA
jgi:hypothetical protein